MTKHEIQYTEGRLDAMRREKIGTPLHKKPNKTASLKEAAKQGTLTLKPACEIKEAAKAAASGRWETTELNFEDLFNLPKSYRHQLDSHESEKRRIEKRAEKVNAFFDSLIDRLNLGEFERGLDAIKEAEAFTV